MAYAKVTDGAVTRFLDLNNPYQRRTYDELMNNRTGYKVVADRTGNIKEFAEAEVVDTIEKTFAANKKKNKKTVVADNDKTIVED